MQNKLFGIHWSQWICPGPSRKFSVDEMALAGSQPWPKSIDGYVLSNVLVLLAINYQTMPRQWVWLICVLSLAGAFVALRVARLLWVRPTRLLLNLMSLALIFVIVAATLLCKFWPPLQLERKAMVLVGALALTFMVLTSMAWWFITILRAQQIENRLRELDEQDRHLKLARRLATAQIQPHFLFNTLASVQHWVDTQDPRAAGTLRSFTAYLRATLPMFERESLSLTEELQIVRSYLEVMQARMGARLQWRAEVCAGVDDLLLPPGLLLTLVENAIGHGIEPALRGGSIAVAVTRPAEGQVLIEVRDDGAGLSSDHTEGLGLRNSRERLRQLYGERARLSLQALSPGCLSRLEIQAMEAKS